MFIAGKRAVIIVALAAFLALPFGGARAAQAAAKQTPQTIVPHYNPLSLNAQERTLIALTQEVRARYGLSEYTIDPELCRIARIKTMDMVNNRYFSHDSPTFGRVRQLLRQEGYSCAGANENIARHRDIAHADAALLSSPGHRNNLLSRVYTHMGVSVYVDKNGFVTLTEIFARK